MLYAIFFRNSWPLIEIAVPKVWVCLVTSMKMRKVCPKFDIQHVYLLHDTVLARKSSAVAQFLKSDQVNVLSHPPYSPVMAPCDFFTLSKIENKIRKLPLNVPKYLFS